jgi:hypothetical protein
MLIIDLITEDFVGQGLINRGTLLSDTPTNAQTILYKN